MWVDSLQGGSLPKFKFSLQGGSICVEETGNLSIFPFKVVHFLVSEEENRQFYYYYYYYFSLQGGSFLLRELKFSIFSFQGGSFFVDEK